MIYNSQTCPYRPHGFMSFFWTKPTGTSVVMWPGTFRQVRDQAEFAGFVVEKQQAPGGMYLVWCAKKPDELPERAKIRLKRWLRPADTEADGHQRKRRIPPKRYSCALYMQSLRDTAVGDCIDLPMGSYGTLQANAAREGIEVDLRYEGGIWRVYVTKKAAMPEPAPAACVVAG